MAKNKFSISFWVLAAPESWLKYTACTSLENMVLLLLQKYLQFLSLLVVTTQAIPI